MSKDQDKRRDADDVGGFLRGVERVGNALPHPAILFVMFAVLVIIASAVFNGTTVDFYDARADEMVTVAVESMLNLDGLRYIFENLTENFIGHPALGTIIVAMLGVGIAEKTGLINTTLKKMMSDVDDRVMTAVVIFAGIMSNIASDAGYVVVIPLGAVIFANAGRHPIAGLAAAFAGVSAGFSANLIIGTTDPLLAGISNTALQGANIDMEVLATDNWYFMFVSTFLLVAVGTYVTDRVVEKNLGTYNGTFVRDEGEITEVEEKGLKRAGIAMLIYVAIMIALVAPANGPLRSAEMVDGVEMMTVSGFLRESLIPAILFLFAIPGTVYGFTTGVIKDSHDLIDTMVEAMKDMGNLLVLVFFLAQFVDYFKHTNLGTVISVNGAAFLEGLGITGLPLIVGFVFLSAFINLFMGGASSKWAIMAPIFLPMMYKLGLSPALTQVAYRIGDSTTNVITPLMSYFAMIVVFAQDYDREAGLGTLISTMLPYTVYFLISWTILLVVWYVFNLPLGPGAFMLV